MPHFDVDLCRVSREPYITGKAAINFQPLEALRVDGISCLTLIEMNRPSYRPRDLPGAAECCARHTHPSPNPTPW